MSPLQPSCLDPAILRKRRFFAIGLLCVVATGMWALDAHQERINQRQALAEIDSLPHTADQVARHLAAARAICMQAQMQDLNQCKLGRETAKNELEAQAGLLAEMSLALEEHFFMRCEYLKQDPHRCRSLLLQAKSARMSSDTKHQ